MRQVVDSQRLRQFMQALGAEADVDSRAYLTGGATAVLLGWRSSTIDIDLKLVPESDAMFRAIPRLKEQLLTNVELAAPDQFIPELPGWRERSPFIVRHGTLSFHHYDFYAQALSKIERGHQQDTVDVRAMLNLRLIEAAPLRRHFDAIEPLLFRYPAIDPPSFRAALEEALRSA